jgi:predicted MFS family arabinose efflux permease
VVREMHAGLAYVRRSRLLLSIISVAMVAFLGAGALSVLDVVFVTRALHQPSDTVGVLLVASGLGQLAGGILSFQFAPRLAHMYHRVLAVSIAFSGVMVLIYSVTPSLESAVVVLFIGGLGFPVMFMAFMTMIQIAVENAFMGRVMSLISTCMAVVMIISTAAGGALTDVFGVRQVIAAGGVSLVAGGLLALRLVRSMPEKRAEEPAAAPVESPSLAT